MPWQQQGQKTASFQDTQPFFFFDIVNAAGDAEAKPQGRQVPSFRWTDFQRCAGAFFGS